MAGFLRWSPAFVWVAVFASAAPGQGFVVSSGSVSFGRGRGGRSASLTLGSYGYGFGPYSSSGGSRVTVINPAPQVVAVPVVILPQSAGPGNDLRDDTPPRRVPERRREPPADVLPAPAPAAVPPLPGQNAGVFRPLDPDNRERARQPVAPEPPAQPAPPGPTEPPLAPLEGATLTDRGRAAFQAGEYGRAADIFRRAAADDPADPRPPFFLVQALTALGKYTAAAEAARAAAERFPGWPALPYRPLDLYGPNAADYAAHLERLARTRAEHPGDPVLLFLSGHVLWFDGRKDEARPLFRRAAPAFPAACERFLRAAPGSVL